MQIIRMVALCNILPMLIYENWIGRALTSRVYFSNKFKYYQTLDVIQRI